MHDPFPRKGSKLPNIEKRRNSKNTKRYKAICFNDRLRLYGKAGFNSGFTSGGVEVKDIDGNYITIADKTYKQVPPGDMELVCLNNNWQFIFCLQSAVEAGEFLPD